MKQIQCLKVLAIVILGLVMLEGIDAQRKGGKPLAASTTPAPEKTPFSIPFLVQPGVTSSGEIDKLVQQNSSLPFALRWPKPERKSDKFHFPMLPSVYWTVHKKPEVPLVEPDQDLGFGFGFAGSDY